jgi:hypothetical protein
VGEDHHNPLEIQIVHRKLLENGVQVLALGERRGTWELGVGKSSLAPLTAGVFSLSPLRRFPVFRPFILYLGPNLFNLFADQIQ